MQLTLGRRWVLELRFSVALRQQVEATCASICTSVQRGARARDAALRWERDKMAGMMLSSWDRDRFTW